MKIVSSLSSHQKMSIISIFHTLISTIQQARHSLSTSIVTSFIVTYTFSLIDWRILSMNSSTNNVWKIFCQIACVIMHSFDILQSAMRCKNRFYVSAIWSHDMSSWNFDSRNVTLSLCWIYKLKSSLCQTHVTRERLEHTCRTYYVMRNLSISLIFSIKCLWFELILTLNFEYTFSNSNQTFNLTSFSINLTKKSTFDVISSLISEQQISTIMLTKIYDLSISKINDKMNVKTNFLNRLKIVLFLNLNIFLSIDITIRIQLIKIKIINFVNLSKITHHNVFNSQLFYRLQNNLYFSKSKASQIRIKIRIRNRKTNKTLKDLSNLTKSKSFLLTIMTKMSNLTKLFRMTKKTISIIILHRRRILSIMNHRHITIRTIRTMSFISFRQTLSFQFIFIVVNVMKSFRSTTNYINTFASYVSSIEKILQYSICNVWQTSSLNSLKKSKLICQQMFWLRNRF